jgi:uncharacterized membrane protein
MALVGQYFITLLVFLAIDAVWLSTLGRKFYVDALAPLLRDHPDFTVAFAFYLLYVAGLLTFVILPNQAATLGRIALAGAFFGLVAYATYDLTNLATLKGFGWRIALIDMTWGAALTAAAASLSVLIGRALKLM